MVNRKFFEPAQVDATPELRAAVKQELTTGSIHGRVGQSLVRNALDSTALVAKNLSSLMAEVDAGSEIARALIPFFCDRLPSPKSRREYATDLRLFVSHLAGIGISPLAANGDHVRLYKEAMVRAGFRPATVARRLSVIRQAYQQFGKKGLVGWNTVGDIQAVSAPRVSKNTTPRLTEVEAKRLLHAQDTATAIGQRDHALLFVYLKTACRCNAIRNARIGDLERTDADWYIAVKEKGQKERRLPLLESAGPVLRWINAAGLVEHEVAPLFPAFEKDRKTPSGRFLSSRHVLGIVKKYASQIGLNVDRLGRRGIGVHSLRKTAAMNALEHGAKVEHVQAWLGHSDIRTTQEYITYSGKDAEEAARHNQIR